MTLASGDTLIDTGAIRGDVTLGSADSLDASQGGVAGTIGASSGDLFEFGGHFGAETIDNFTAGAGPTHDTLEFATSDFASYAALTSAMSQAGSDVMIRLDATEFDRAQPRQYVEPRLRGFQVRVGCASLVLWGWENLVRNLFVKIGIRATFARSPERERALRGARQQGRGEERRGFLFGIAVTP